MNRWRTRLSNWARPPRTLKVTTPGRILIGLTLGVGLGALNTGNNLLYLVLGAGLSTIVLSGILSESCLRDLRIRRLGADAPFAQEPFAFRYALSCKRGFSFSLLIEEVSAELKGAARVALVSSKEETVVRGDLTAPRRGPYPLTGIRVTTLYPLGLFAKSRVFDLEETLWVYPRRIQRAGPATELGISAQLDGGSRPAREGTGDLAGFRELQEGDDARRIHWAKSAAVGKLVRTERDREENAQYWIEVEGPLGDSLERRCEEAAAQAQRFLAKGFEVGLKTSKNLLRPAAGPAQQRRILFALACIGYEKRT